jgi:hypothetical protein
MTDTHDLIEVRRRVRRLMERVGRRDDYGRLLAAGQIVRIVEEVDDPEAWRAEIRRQARADRIRVRTAVSADAVYAFLRDGATEARAAETERYKAAMRRAIPAAVASGHEPSVFLRDGGEVICGCNRCLALGYIEAFEPAVIVGSLFEDACTPGDAAKPRTTALAQAFGRRER